MEQSYIQESIQLLESSRNQLNEICRSCCMEPRRKNMQQLMEDFTTALQILNSEKELPRAQEHISLLGGHIGRLYAGCCTETREHLYQNILSQLNRCHRMLDMVLGQGH